MRFVRIGEPRCFSAVTKSAVYAASITVGSSTSKGAASTCLGAAGQPLQDEGADHGLPDDRTRRRDLDVHGSPGAPTAPARLRMDACTPHASHPLQDVRRLQLSAGSGGGPGHLALLVCS